jgi:peptidoglycan/xylan/chitin deacetylase (PgdA/CDA1 family)
MTPRGVPVVMYHSVGPPRADWIWNYLTTSVNVFEAQMKLLVERGWTAITLADLHAHMSKGAKLPPKPVVLTFDDGYLDNWVYAYPVIKQYNLHAVVWMTTDFVDPSTVPRPTVDDVRSGRLEATDLVDRGYLSWEEMRRMAAGGHVEIQPRDDAYVVSQRPQNYRFSPPHRCGRIHATPMAGMEPLSG